MCTRTPSRRCMRRASRKFSGAARVREVAAFQYLRGVIDSLIEQKDIDAISLKIANLLDESVVVNDAEAFKARQYNAEYQIIQKGKTWDLSKINFDKLREEFKQATHKNIEIADLRAFLQHKLELMLQQNATRTDFAQRLQEIIDKYNSGGSSTENSLRRADEVRRRFAVRKKSGISAKV